MTASAVINARPLQVIHTWDPETAPLHASGDESCVTGNFIAIAERENAVRPFHPQAGHFLRRDDFNSEPLRLHNGATRQVAAAQAGGEAEVILDTRTQAS